MRVWRMALGSVALLAGMASFQVSGAIAVPVLHDVGVAGTCAVRFLIGAVVACLVARPRLRGRAPSEWTGLVTTGAVMTGMTFSSFAAYARLPQGTAATLEFLGPLAVAVAASRRPGHLLSATLALLGVVLMAGPTWSGSATGVGYALGTAVLLGAFVLLRSRVAVQGEAVLESTALSLAVAAVMTLPITVVTVPTLDLDQAGWIAISAVTGVGLGYGLEAFGISRVGPSTAGLLYGLDPALAAVAGFLVLNQVLPGSTQAGMVLVTVAGLLSGQLDFRRRERPRARSGGRGPSARNGPW